MTTTTKHDGPIQIQGLKFDSVEATIVADDFEAAATTDTVAITVPDPCYVMGVRHRVDVPFSGGGAGAVAIDVGILGGNVDALVDNLDAFGATALDEAEGPPDAATGLPLRVTGGSISVLATADVNLSGVDTGQLTLRVNYFTHEEIG